MAIWFTDSQRHETDWVKRSAFLETAVDLFILKFQRNGGPDTLDRERARRFSEQLGHHGDALIEPVKPKAATAKNAAEPGTAQVAGDLARYLAVMAFEPGGVTFKDLHFEVASCTREEALEGEQQFKQAFLTLIEEDHECNSNKQEQHPRNIL